MSIESKDIKRWNMLPVQEVSVFSALTKAKGAYWIEGEIDDELSKDSAHWEKMKPSIKKFIIHILAFFASADGIAGDNAVEIGSRVNCREVKAWYNFTAMMEDIHNIVYGKLIQQYEPNPEAQEAIFNSVHNFPAIKHKINWIYKWVGKNNTVPKHLKKNINKLIYTVKDIMFALGIDSNAHPVVESLEAAIHTEEIPLPQIIIANAIMEGIFFSASFCAIFWINHRFDGKLPGLTKANEFISRDEGTHTSMAIYLYNKYYKGSLSAEKIRSMVDEAVMIEEEFVDNAMGVSGVSETLETPGKSEIMEELGMNPELMMQYVRYTADQFLVLLGISKLYNVENPFSFMNKQSIGLRLTDFFMDVNVAEYSSYTSGRSAQENKLSLDDDF